MQFIMIMVIIIIIDSVTGVCIYDIILSIVILGVPVEQYAGLNQHTASTLCLECPMTASFSLVLCS